MDPADFFVLSAMSAALTAVYGMRYRQVAATRGSRRTGAQLAAAGMATGRAAGRMAAVSGRVVGTGIEVTVAAVAWPAGLLLDGALGIVDLAGTTVGAVSRSGRRDDRATFIVPAPGADD